MPRSSDAVLEGSQMKGGCRLRVSVSHERLGLTDDTFRSTPCCASSLCVLVCHFATLLPFSGICTFRNVLTVFNGCGGCFATAQGAALNYFTGR